MGNLIWHEYSRLLSITSCVYTIWASFWGFYYRKFFWDFVGGIVRSPGGLQPSRANAIFITLIVKAPIIQILSMILAFVILAIEFPLPQLKGSSIHRSFIVRVPLLLLQAFLTVLFYQNKFEKAKEEGDLLFFPSTVQKHKEGEIEYEIRLCPALQHKPHLPTPHFDPRQKNPDGKPDPFEPPYIENLYIGEVKDEEDGKEYVALLNKYCVIPLHFLLASKKYESQASPLLPPDLVQIYLLLLAAKKAGSPFFAFYNCGDRSGASQPHKHIQLLPLEDENGPPSNRLALNPRKITLERPFSLSSLPYANHIFRLPLMSVSTPIDEIEEKLSQAFLSLLDLVISTVRHDPHYPAGTPSYNAVLTLDHLHLIPRAEENYTLKETGDQLSINAVGFAGMLLVKSEDELEAVKREGVGKILRGVGLESIHDMQVEGTALEAEQVIQS
ncbi:hypothetical protein NEOLEDRAFT_1160702 [Neolentinus lepideus HHB14362 ss-1]|uniref:Uncharacterized protein n=1 Tax=Neolentinus lepideus HHB14362 ss-1 TaxID=1314782 RepID=A0A165V1Y8_9AGAM|nr:hypothetical protein NEOLEDRAFT_1160702 [Neolentinus lepideus HHB14362 ss-1]